MQTPASSGRHVLGDSLLIDWLHGPDARDAVLRIMGLCGDKAKRRANRLHALDQFFKWLLSRRAAGRRGAPAAHQRRAPRHQPLPRRREPKPKRDAKAGTRRGHPAFTNDQVEEWLDACKDDVRAAPRRAPPADHRRAHQRPAPAQSRHDQETPHGRAC